jgi:hypothetical protein
MGSANAILGSASLWDENPEKEGRCIVSRIAEALPEVGLWGSTRSTSDRVSTSGSSGKSAHSQTRPERVMKLFQLTDRPFVHEFRAFCSEAF